MNWGMKKITFIICVFLLFMVSCTNRRNTNEFSGDKDNIAIVDPEHSDTLYHPSPDEFDDGHVPPPPPDGKHFDGAPPPPHVKDHHKPDNMRGFDPASEDDMDDNGMSRYMENNDEEGWD